MYSNRSNRNISHISVLIYNYTSQSWRKMHIDLHAKCSYVVYLVNSSVCYLNAYKQTDRTILTGAPQRCEHIWKCDFRLLLPAVKGKRNATTGWRCYNKAWYLHIGYFRSSIPFLLSIICINQWSKSAASYKRRAGSECTHTTFKPIDSTAETSIGKFWN